VEGLVGTEVAPVRACGGGRRWRSRQAAAPVGEAQCRAMGDDASLYGFEGGALGGWKALGKDRGASSPATGHGGRGGLRERRCWARGGNSRP
jgi:hypothetical protein